MMIEQNISAVILTSHASVKRTVISCTTIARDPADGVQKRRILVRVYMANFCFILVFNFFFYILRPY